MCSTTMQVSAKSDCPFPNFAFKYLREDEKFRETVLACSYGAQVESFKPRKWSKILWHCPCMWFITVAWSDLQFCPSKSLLLHFEFLLHYLCVCILFCGRHDVFFIKVAWTVELRRLSFVSSIIVVQSYGCQIETTCVVGIPTMMMMMMT